MNHADKNIDIPEFEKSSGVGVTVTPEEIEKVVEKIISANKNDLIEKRYSFNIGTLMGKFFILIGYSYPFVVCSFFIYILYTFIKKKCAYYFGIKI